MGTIIIVPPSHVSMQEHRPRVAKDKDLEREKLKTILICICTDISLKYWTNSHSPQDLGELGTVVTEWMLASHVEVPGISALAPSLIPASC